MTREEIEAIRKLLAEADTALICARQCARDARDMLAAHGEAFRTAADELAQVEPHSWNAGISIGIARERMVDRLLVEAFK